MDARRLPPSRPSLGLAASFACALCAVSWAPPAAAADRALLIGATSYADPRFDLDGIDLDLDTMRRFARRVGFAEDDIMTLSGEAVTALRLRDAFEGFLGAGTRPGERVLVYYSGHGLQVPDLDGDEADGRDEALTLHGLALSGNGYAGTLIDDEIDALFAPLAGRDVFFVVDACHSGTISRGLVERPALRTRAYGAGGFAVKALPWRGGRADDAIGGATAGPPIAPKTAFAAGGESTLDGARPGLVTLAAAQDHEQALASSQGSTFTLALYESLETAPTGATPRALVERAGRLIDARIDDARRFVPNLTGDRSLFDTDLTAPRPVPVAPAAAGAAPSPSPDGVNREDLLALATGAVPLAARLDRERYAAEAAIGLEVDVPGEGWINVLGVDADDAMVVLWPNEFERDNRVVPGTLSLPGERAFEWRAQPPWGSNLMLVLFSRAPLDLFATSLQKDLEGRSTAAFALPSAGALRRTRSMGASAELAAATLEFDTCESDVGRCGP